MVTSVVAPVLAFSIAFSGAAAAAPPTNTSSAQDDTRQLQTTRGSSVEVADVSFSTAGSVSDVTVNLSAGNNASAVQAGDVTEVTVRLYGNGSQLASATADYDAEPTTVSVASGNVSGVDRVQIIAQVSETADDEDTIDAVFTLTENGTGASTTWDTDNTQVVEVDGAGFIKGTVTDTNGNPVSNVTIQIINRNTGTVVYNTTSRSDGTFGPNKTAPGQYRARVVDPRFKSFSKNVNLSANETEDIPITLERILYAARIEVKPTGAVTEFVGQTQMYTVTVYDQNNNPLDDVRVNVSKLSPSSPVTLLETVERTGPNGTATFNVTAPVVSSATLRFTAENTSGTPDPTALRGITFIQNGEGWVSGQVLDARTTSGLEDARVWAVFDSTYRQNQQYTRVNLNALSAAGISDDDDTIWIRLVDRDTGEIIDNDNYDVRTDEYNLTGTIDANNDTAIRKIEELNESNEAVGEGFAVKDLDGDGLIAWTHTRLSPQDYYAQVSLDAWNASDMAVRDNSRELFVNVTNATANGTVTDLGAGLLGPDETPVAFNPTANLTLQRAMELSSLSGMNMVDAPGFVNTYGVDTNGTDEDGDFLLNKLYTEFQVGRGYVLIASKPSYSTDFADVYVEEDGDLKLNVDSSDKEAMVLAPEDVEPERVDIKQIGTRQNLSASTDNFSDQTDATFQEVPRDGRTVDVMRVRTLTEDGALIQANATIEIRDLSNAAGNPDNVSGAFVAVDGGDIVRPMPGDEDSVTVNTGSDGVAHVLYRSDSQTRSTDALKCATLEADRSAVDCSNVTFVGVLTFRKASISGKVTDTDDDGLRNAAVWAQKIEWPTRSTVTGQELRITIRPTIPAGVSPGTPEYAAQVDSLDDTFEVTLYRDTDTTTTALENQGTVTVTAAQLQNFTFGVFPGINNPTAAEFKLYDQTDEDASYTLDPVPALDSDTTTDYTIRAVKFDDPQIGSVSNDGLAEVLPLTTDDANVVIPINVTTTAGVDVDGDGSVSTDTDGDGLHEDVNGDGSFTIADIQVLFQNRESSVVQNNAALFDFNNDGSVSIADVQALFQEQQSA